MSRIEKLVVEGVAFASLGRDADSKLPSTVADGAGADAARKRGGCTFSSKLARRTAGDARDVHTRGVSGR